MDFSKKILLVCIMVMSLLCIYGNETYEEVASEEAVKKAGLEESDWFSEVSKSIEESEYKISYSESRGLLQSPNRANNIRYFYFDRGFEAESRDGSSDFKIKLTLLDYGKEIKTAYEGGTSITNGNECYIEGDKIDIEYINNKDGLRQNFIIKNKPAGYGDLKLHIGVDGNVSCTVEDGIVIFDRATKRVMEYKDLKVYDSEGKVLKSRFQKTSSGFKIIVCDYDAVYPITIDPLSASPAWTGESNQASACYGISVSSSGDVNGDGYSDVLVGALQYDHGQNNEGAAFVYYGSSSGVSSSYSWMDESDIADALFGCSVSSAGDVNGDGYGDIIIGAYAYTNGETSEGSAYIYYGSSSGLSATPDRMYESDQENAKFGYSVSSAGDVNGDGYSDVIIGAYSYDNGQTDEGAAFVYYGSVTGLPAIPDWTCESNQNFAGLGVSVSSAGDVNGDGYSDIIVGAYHYSNGEIYEGAAFVYNGSASGLSETGICIGEANQEYASYGFSVSSAGDVNGDGYSDVIVGAYLYNNGQTNEGSAFVYYGSASGNLSTPAWSGESNQLNGYYGRSVSSAGDVNGDGYSDIIVGAMNYDNTQVDGGSAFVYFGSAGGLSATYNWTSEPYQSYANYGFCVSSAGDVNGDGYSDVIVGAYTYDNGQTDEGAAFVYYGSPQLLSATFDWRTEQNQASASYGISVSSARDVNGDGYSDVIVGAPYYDNGQSDEGVAFVYHGSSSGLSSAYSWMGESNQASAYFGCSVSSAGDVNGDGYGDIIVGAHRYDNGQTDEGAAFVYYGSSTGLSTTRAWLGESNQASSEYGMSVSSAGDVNGDGYSDIIVGAKLYSNGQSGEGASFVYHGSSSGLSSAYSWRGESNQASAYFGCSVSSAGDVNGDGYSDVIIGAESYNNTLSDEGAAFVYYGTSSGLSSVYAWMENGWQENAYFGGSVSTAGDVNGDGYSDVIVGADYYDLYRENGGIARVYHGSSSGLSTVSNWIDGGNQINESYGKSVSSAGDINGDGFSDIIVGAYLYDNGQTDEGAAFIYYGSSSGVSAAYDWQCESNQASAYYGYSVSSAGDVNGDGYSDVIIGAHMYDGGQTNEGTVYVYCINRNVPSVNPMQKRADETAMIVAPLYCNYDNRFKISLLGRSYSGRSRVKLQWEVKPLGTQFNAAGLNESAKWYDTGLDGVDITEQASGLSINTYYKWRVRVKYDVSMGAVQPHSRWYYISDNAPAEVDLKTTGYTSTNMMSVNGKAKQGCIEIMISGSGNKYVIEKKVSENYKKIGETDASNYTDVNPVQGINEYIIRQYNDRTITASSNLSIYYSETDKSSVNFYKEIAKLNERIDAEKLTVYDINGRTVERITNKGIYYITKESNGSVITCEKVILMY